MNYSSFTEFLNFSREANEMLGTSSTLKIQTDVKTDSWAACTETLQSLLEQYISDPRSLSSIKQISWTSNTVHRNASDETEKPQEHVTSQAPPPLLHRPPKRLLEQSHVAITSPERKRPRQDVEEDYLRSLLKDSSNVREEMFEKSRSLGSSLKQLRPPPPLLKQVAVDGNGLEHRKCGPQDHYTFTREGYEMNAEKNKTRLRGHCSEQTEPIKTERWSHLSPVGKPEPAPREIGGDCKSSCGGYAFDHTAMPKIVAVHSISKSAEDVEEWERNKAFISKVKAEQNKPGNPVQGEQKNSQMARLVSEQTKKTSVEDPFGYKETHQSTVENERNKASEQVSFERYVLYHLLSKFQGNVEQVKRVLKQNLLQEWQSYCQGNVDPRRQTFNGVNFYELRKLYEIWCQLHKTKQAQSSTVQTVSNAQMSSTSRIQTQGKLKFLQNQPSVFRNSQRFRNSQQFQAAYSKPNQRNRSPQIVSNFNQAIPRSPVHSLRTPQPSHFEQKIHNGVVGGIMTKNGSSKHIPMQIQENICSLSENSSRGPIRHDASSLPAALLGQHNTSTTRGNCLTNPSTYHMSSRSTPADLFPYFNKSRQISRADMCQGNSVIKRTMPRDPRDQGQTEVFPSTQENVIRNHCEDPGRSKSKILVQEQERDDGTNISSLTLLRISQTNSKPNQTQLLPSGQSAPSPLGCNIQVNRESVQSQHPLKQASHLETHSKDTVRGQEAKANYLWRFKGGKLISDSMPSINDGEPITKVDIPVSTQRKFTQSCNFQTSQTDHQILVQQHKKVCGAAASGQRCYCVLEPNGGLQRAQKGKSPIQSMQQMINKTNKSTTDSTRELSIQSQSSNVQVQDFRSVSTTPSTQVKTRNAQGTQQRHTGLQAQDTQTYTALSNSHKTQSAQHCHARLPAHSTQPYVGLGNSPNVQVNEQVSSGLENAQDIQQSYSGLTISSNAQASHQNYANHRIYSKMQANAQSNSDLNILSNAHENHQYYTRSDLTDKNEQGNLTTSDTNGKQSYTSFNISSNSHRIQPSSADLSYTSNAQSNQKSNTGIKFTGIEQAFQSSYAESGNSSTAQESQRSITSPKNSLVAQLKLKSNDNIRLPSYTQANQQSTAKPLVSQSAEANHKPYSSLKHLLDAQSNHLSNASLHISSNAQAKEQTNPNLLVTHNVQANQQSKARTSLTAEPNQQSNASLRISCNQQASQQSNSSFHVSRNAQTNQQSNTNPKTSPNTQKNQQSNVTMHILNPGNSVLRIAPKDDKAPSLKPTSAINLKCQTNILKKTEFQDVVKSKNVKENEKVKEKQCSFPAPLTLKKQYNSLQQLAKKVIETRKRFEMESIPWKKKILKSLEGVLMKRLRKIERDTGEEADLGESSVNGENTSGLNNQK